MVKSELVVRFSSHFKTKLSFLFLKIIKETMQQITQAKLSIL